MPAQNEERHRAAFDQGRIDAGPLALFPPGTAASIRGGSHAIALVNDAGTVYAIADLCLRCSHPLSDGTLAGGLLTCAHCGWQYELKRECLAALPALRIESHRVRIEDGHVYVDLGPGLARSV